MYKIKIPKENREQFIKDSVTKLFELGYKYHAYKRISTLESFVEFYARRCELSKSEWFLFGFGECLMVFNIYRSSIGTMSTLYVTSEGDMKHFYLEDFDELQSFDELTYHK